MGAQSRSLTENEFMLRLHNQNLIAELSRREEQFRALVDNAFEGIIVTNADNEITYASPAMRQMGLDPAAMIGKSAFSFLQMDEAESIKATMETYGGTTPRGAPLEFHVTNLEGKIHWFEASVTDMREDPSVGGFVLNMRDITERKRSQMEIINQSRVLEALATGAPISEVMALVALGAEEANPDANVAIYLADDQLNLTVCATPSFPDHFKQAIAEFWENNKRKAFGEVVTRDEGLLVLPDLLSFKDQPDVIEFAKAYNVRGLWMQRFKAADLKGGSGSIAVYHEHPREPSKWERTYLQNTAQLAAIAINRRRAEQNLREATHAAELANRAKTKFLANMSHELRTPLNAIIGFSDIMKSELFGPMGSERYAEYAKDINDSGAHLLNVIDDILDISKIEAGRYSLEECDMDLAPTLTWSIEMVRPKTVEKNISVTLDVEPDLPPIHADARAIRQIMLNLLSNATKFTPDNGNIRVSAQLEGDGSLLLSIADNGIGIPEDKLETVLEPFGQVDDTSARQHGGTGLGLSITKALVELHEGAFQLESALGMGTTARLRFPAQRLRPLAREKRMAAD
jgi:PAS domain S-box-containing protein